MATSTGTVTSQLRALENVLTGRNIIRTKSVSEAFRKLKTTIQKRNTSDSSDDVVAALEQLESCLKTERHYKNIRTEFDKAKLEFLKLNKKQTDVKKQSTDQGPPKETGTHDPPLAVAATQMTVVNKKRTQRQDKIHVVTKQAQKDISKQLLVNIDDGKISHDEISSLNKTIQRLFDHLDIGKNHDGRVDPKQKHPGRDPHEDLTRGVTYTAISLSAKARQKKRNDDAFKSILQKLTKFEEEFQLRKMKQQSDLKMLQEENNTVRLQLTKQTREIDRLRGTHSIISKAKGKHVEKLEERYMSERKWIESKVSELEETTRKSVQKFEKAVKDKTDLENSTRKDMLRIKSEVYRLHKMANRTDDKNNYTGNRVGRQSPRNVVRRGVLAKSRPETYNVDDFVEKLEKIGESLQKMQEDKTDVTRNVNISGKWEAQFKDVETVIENLSVEFGLDNLDMEETDRHNKSRRQFSFYASVDSLRSKTDVFVSRQKAILRSLRALIIRRNEELTIHRRSLKDKQCELEETKVNLLDITEEITKVYGCIDNSQYDDVSSVISSPRRIKDTRPSSYNSSKRQSSEKRQAGKLMLLDELPEAEGMGHDNALKKLEHIRKSLQDQKVSSEKKEKDVKNLLNDFETLKSRINTFYRSCKIGSSTRSPSIGEGGHDGSTLIKSQQWATSSGQDASDECRISFQKLSALETAFCKLIEDHVDKERIDAKLELLSSDLLKVQTEVTIFHGEVIVGSQNNSASKNVEENRSRKRSSVTYDSEEFIKNMRECRVKFVEKEKEVASLNTKLQSQENELERVRQCINRMQQVFPPDSKQRSDIDSPSSTPFRDLPKHVLQGTEPNTSQITQSAPSTMLSDLEEQLRVAFIQKRNIESAPVPKANDPEKRIKELQQEVMKLTTRMTIREEELNQYRRDFQRMQTEGHLILDNDIGFGEEVQMNFQTTPGVKSTESLKKRVNILQRRLSTTEQELSEALRQRDVLVNRISEKAAAELTENNPLIIDLSDPHRPEKLAEKYMQLYDDEWTSAFETMSEEHGSAEEDAIAQLLEIITEAYGVSKRLAEKQIQSVWRALFVDDIIELQIEEDIMPCLTKTDMKMVKDLRKNTATHTGRFVFNIFTKKNVKSVLIESDAMKTFVKQCVELTWLMNMQDPPVVLDCSTIKGDNFNTNLFRQYTKTGDTVSYLVWPALRLYDDGPVIYKGVAQPL